MSGGFNWAKWLHDQGKAAAELAQARADLKRMETKLDALAKSLHDSQTETKVLVGKVRGGYKTIATTAVVVGAVATLVARWWVATHTGG